MKLAETCRKVGSNLQLVQGPGGNISLKEGDSMLIKASGLLLKEVTEERGCISVNHNDVQKYLAGLPENLTWTAEVEHDYLSFMRKARSDDSAMPSLETGFHSFLSDAVIHTHPLALNAYLCSKEGPGILKKIFPEAIVVPYATVGVVLSKAIQAAGAKAGDSRPIFLLNHGLIIHSETLQEAYDRTLEVVERLQMKLPDEPKNSKSPAVAMLIEKGLEKSLEKHFFPDSVVYCDSYGKGGITLHPDGLIDASGTKSPTISMEVMHANACIALGAQALGGLNYLPDNEVKNIRHMESEKYRQSV